MFYKRITSAHWRNDLPSATLLYYNSSGELDKGFMEKIAGDEVLPFGDFEKKAGNSYVHLISVGAGEYYDSNNNGDFYNEKEASVTSHDGNKTEHLKGGLTKFHNTYMRFGGVYRNHNNKVKGFQKEGGVVAERYNPGMHRGELIIELENEKWAPTLQKIAKGIPTYWSQGSGVPADLCSACLHRAKSRKEYCEHLKYAMNQLTPEGKRICAINDEPYFHDISEVDSPAEKIAWTLEKVASGEMKPEFDIPMPYLPLELIMKTASWEETIRYKLLGKLAELESHIEKQATEYDQAVIEGLSLTNDENRDLTKIIAPYSLDSTLSALHSKKYMLPPKTFASILMSKAASDRLTEETATNVVGLLKEALNGIYQQKLASSDLTEFISDGSYAVSRFSPSCDANVAMSRVGDFISMESGMLHNRIVRRAISGQSEELEKTASTPTEIELALAKRLADEYARYQVSYLSSIGANDNDIRMAVLRKMAT